MPRRTAIRAAVHGLVLLAFIASTPVFFEDGLFADHVFDVNVVLLADVFVRLHTGVK
jgi:hypothetical protein